MKLHIKNVDVRNLDRDDITAEYNERLADDDAPRREESVYYLHRGHRVHVEPIDNTGEPMTIEVTEDLQDAFRSIEDEINDAIRAAGATAQSNWMFSEYALCGTCPCSGGFFVEGTGTEKLVFLTVEIDMSA